MITIIVLGFVLFIGGIGATIAYDRWQAYNLKTEQIIGAHEAKRQGAVKKAAELRKASIDQIEQYRKAQGSALDQILKATKKSKSTPSPRPLSQKKKLKKSIDSTTLGDLIDQIERMKKE